MTPKGYHRNPLGRDPKRHCTQVVTRDRHAGSQIFVDTVKTDTQTMQRRPYPQTQSAHQVDRDPSVCPWTLRQEMAGLCHPPLEPPAPQLRGQWVPPNPHQAFATICEHTAEMQGGGVAQEGGCVWARELTGPSCASPPWSRQG